MTMSWRLLNVRPLWNLRSSLWAVAIGCKRGNRRRCCLDLIKRQNSFSFYPEIASSELFLFCRKYSISYQHTLWRQIQKWGMINFWLTWPAKVHLVKAMVFPVVMYGCELDYKESWAPKNWCFWTVVLEKTLESPLDCKEIKPINPKGNQPWIFIERTDAEAETLIFLPPDVKNWLIGKDRPWCWERLMAGGEEDGKG